MALALVADRRAQGQIGNLLLQHFCRGKLRLAAGPLGSKTGSAALCPYRPHGGILILAHPLHIAGGQVGIGNRLRLQGAGLLLISRLRGAPVAQSRLPLILILLGTPEIGTHNIRKWNCLKSLLKDPGRWKNAGRCPNKGPCLKTPPPVPPKRPQAGEKKPASKRTCQPEETQRP